MSSTKRKILVTGSTGQIGSALVRYLISDPDLQVIAGARSPERADHLGVPVVHLDYDESATLAPAMDGVDSLFMMTGYTVDMLRQSKLLVNAAKKAGVKHIVHLGAPGDDDTMIAHWGWHQFVERYIEWSGVAFTHLRPELFMQNLLAYGGAQSVGDDGVIRHYVGNARISWVDCDDVALVAAACLRDPGRHAGKTYRLGYEAKTYAEIAALLTQVVGQKISYESRPPKEFLQQMLAAGADPAYMQCVYHNWIAYAAGAIPGADEVFDNFREITGVEPRTWADFAMKHADKFRYA
jgi:NAD(P)H dehydrogenase (quinone)